MAGTFFKIDAENFIGKLTSAAEKIKDTQDLMNAIGETLVSGAKDRFAEEKAPDGTKWIKGKKTSGKTLSGRTGLLKKSITLAKADMKEIIYGSNMEYAATHQFGRGAIPERQFIGVSEEDKKEASDMIRQHIEDVFKK